MVNCSVAKLKKMMAVLIIAAISFCTAEPAAAAVATMNDVQQMNGSSSVRVWYNGVSWVKYDNTRLMMHPTDNVPTYGWVNWYNTQTKINNYINSISAKERTIAKKTRFVDKKELETLSQSARAFGVYYMWMEKHSSSWPDVLKPDGSISYQHYNASKSTHGFMPMLELQNTENIYFLSAAKGESGKGDNIGAIDMEVYRGANDYKMTLKDAAMSTVTISNQSVLGSRVSIDTLSENSIVDGTRTINLRKDSSAEKMTLDYAGGITGNDKCYVSALVYNKDTGKLVGYTNIAVNTVSGTDAVLDLSNLPAGRYTIKFFNEVENDQKKTDYGSAFTGNYDFDLTANHVLSESYRDKSLTVNIQDEQGLGFQNAEYDTKVSIGSNQRGTIIADETNGTTLNGSVTVSAGGRLSVVNAFTLTGKNTINGTVAGGELDIAGGTTTVSSSGSIESELTVSTGGTLEAYAASLKNNVTNNGTVDLTGGTLSCAIEGAGTTEIVGDVTADAKISTAITVGTGKTLTASADNIDGGVTNNGTVDLIGGTLETDITNAGIVKFDAGSGNTIEASGSFTENGLLEVASGMLDYTGNLIENKIKIDAGATLDPNANVFGGDIENNGTLVLTGEITDIAAPVTADTGYLNANVTGSGTVEIGDGASPAHVYLGSGKQITAGTLEIKAGAEYTGAAGAMTISDAVNNAGTLNLTGGTFRRTVNNSGTVTLKEVSFKQDGERDIINKGTVIAKEGINEFDKGISGAEGKVVAEDGAVLKGRGGDSTEISAESFNGDGKFTVENMTVNAAESIKAGELVINSARIAGKGRTETVAEAKTFTENGETEIKDITFNVTGTADIKGELTLDNAELNGGEMHVGGSIYLDNAELRSVTLTVDKDFSMANADKATGTIAVNGNTSFKGAGTSEIDGNVTPYGYLDFWLDGYSDKDAIVRCAGTFDLSRVKTSEEAPYGIRLFQEAGTRVLTKREQYITLIDGGVTGYKGSHNKYIPDEIPVLRKDKLLTGFKYGIYEENGTLYAAYVDLMALERGKSLAEGRMAAMTALNEAGDLITDNAIRTLNATNNEWQSFAAVRGTHGHYETGSYVDTNGTSAAGGLVKKLSENTALGIFAEGGYTHYNSLNDFNNFGQVTAKGNVNYFGGGILLRTDADATDKGNLYGEASVRAGHQSQDYASENIMPGTSVRYDADSRYIAAHAGVGYKHKLKSGNTMDTYVKYLYAHQGGSDVTIAATGETVNYEPIESHRVRAGFRYTKTVDANFKAFGGLAYEYEFSSEAASSTEGLAIAAPEMKGGSGVAELGMTYKKNSSPWELDFSINGAAGKRESISVVLNAWYEIGKKTVKAAVEKIIKPAEPKKAETQPKTIAEAQRAQEIKSGAERFEKIFGGRRSETEKADRKTPGVSEIQKQTDEQLAAGAAEQKQTENKTQGAADAKRRGTCVNSGTLPAYIPEKKKPQPEKTEKQRTEKISRPEKPEKPHTSGCDAKTGEIGGLGVLESPLLITK